MLVINNNYIVIYYIIESGNDENEIVFVRVALRRVSQYAIDVSYSFIGSRHLYVKLYIISVFAALCVSL